MRQIFSSLMIAVLLLAITACAGSDNAIPPVTEPGMTLGASSHEGLSQTHLWGYWDVYVDIANSTAYAVPARGACFAANIVTFLNASAANLQLNVIGTLTGPGYVDVDLDIGIKHPFPTLPQYRAYDVRGIFMGKGSKQMAHNPDLKYARFSTTDQVMYDYQLTAPDPYLGPVGMPDGYTRWFNAPEFPNSGVFGYTKGKLATPGYTPTATLNPYKYFADGLAPSQNLCSFLAATGDNGVFHVTSTNWRNYYLRFPTATGIKFGYAVVASWIDETTHPANAPEAVAASVRDTSSVYYCDPIIKGGDLVLDVDVFDWDSQPVGGVMEDYKLIVESTVLSGPYYATTSDMTPTGSGPNFYSYHLEIPADNITGLPLHEFWVIVQSNSENYTNPFGVPNSAGTDKLVSCFRPDNSLLTIASSVVDAHSDVMDDVSVIFKSLVSSGSLQDDLDDIVDEAAFVDWGPPLIVYRINNETIPDPDVLEQFRTEMKNFIATLTSVGDSLFYVNWFPNTQTGLPPFTTLAVVAPDDTVRYEPILDTELRLIVWPEEGSEKDSIGSGENGRVYPNETDDVKATARVFIQSPATPGGEWSIGFTSTAKPPSKITEGTYVGGEWFCCPKPGWECYHPEYLLDYVQCGNHYQSFWLKLDLGNFTYKETNEVLQAWACVDGTGGKYSGKDCEGH